jgi:glucose/arabinose dehydrogenase
MQNRLTRHLRLANGRLPAALLVCALWDPSTLHAAALPNGFYETAVASGLSSPTAMQFSPDGRLFVCLQGGQLRVIKNGALLPAPFLTVSVSSSGERGLLGVAFDPNFATTQYVYVYYTATTPTVHNRVSRFTASGDVAVPGSEVVILELNTLSASPYHNGGALQFGADGKLYVGVGDNATGANAQTLANLLGKVLRINADGTPPPDNPFYQTATGTNRAIWALGLRNPFAIAPNPGGPAPEMVINDVGEDTWEEVNDAVAGANYGWPATEGPTTNPAYRSPWYAYSRSGGACAITGGAFYTPPVMQFPPEYLNDYFFTDFCGGWIRRLDPTAGNAVTTFATGIPFPVDLDVGPDGSLYYLARGAGAVYRVQYGTAAPSITTHPASRTVSAGAAATFTVQASGTNPLSYQWQRNGVDIAGATASSYTLQSATPAASGSRFRVRVSNSIGSVTSNEAVLTVAGGPPAAPALSAYVNGLTLRLTWSASPDASSYRLEAGRAAGATDLYDGDVGSTTTLDAVVPAGRYFIRVRAVNGFGPSPPSNELELSIAGTAPCATAPPAPTGYTVQTSGLVARFAWSSSPSATDYIVEAGSSAGRADLASVPIGPVLAFVGSAPAGTYFTRVRAANACGVSTPSAEIPITLACGGVPPAPAALTVTRNGTLLTLSWTGTLAASSYRLQAGTTAGQFDALDADVGDVTTLTFTLAGIPAGTYFVRVRATTACGPSGSSNEVTIAVP